MEENLFDEASKGGHHKIKGIAVWHKAIAIVCLQFLRLGTELGFHIVQGLLEICVLQNQILLLILTD